MTSNIDLTITNPKVTRAKLNAVASKYETWLRRYHAPGAANEIAQMSYSLAYIATHASCTSNNCSAPQTACLSLSRPNQYCRATIAMIAYSIPTPDDFYHSNSTLTTLLTTEGHYIVNVKCARPGQRLVGFHSGLWWSKRDAFRALVIRVEAIVDEVQYKGQGPEHERTGIWTGVFKLSGLKKPEGEKTNVGRLTSVDCRSLELGVTEENIWLSTSTLESQY